MVLVPEGEFILGIDPQNQVSQFMTDTTAALNAQPRQTISLEAFYIDRYEVTFQQFTQFKPETAYEVKDIGEPVRGISWYEADAYCLWRRKRLPTEFEWEKAARGGDDRLFVWGNTFHRDYANMGKTVRPGGNFKQDTTALGIYDLNGNVSEWTADWYQPYPDSKHKDKGFGKLYKVIRGGSIQKKEHGFMKEFTMVPYRNFAPPNQRFWDTGFRCARSL